MNSGRVHKLKVALALVTVAYVAYLQLQEEKEKKKKRKETMKRRYELIHKLARRGSSSSDENEEYQPPRQKMSFLRHRVKVEPQSNDEMDGRSQNHSNTSNVNRLKVDPYFVDSFVSKFSEEQFKDAFRISRNTADRLFIHFKSSPEYNNIFKLSDQTRIPAKHYIWMFLWFAGRKCSYLELSKMFNVPLCKSVCVVDTVLQFFNNCARDFIRFPETPTEMRASADSFAQIADFPEVIACLISTQIQAKATQGEPFTVQVFCDSKGRFLDVYVDSTCNTHPTEVLEKSQMNEKLKDICQGRYYTLAEADYFPREWLLTPIEESNSDEQNIRYNRKHEKTMRVVSDSLELLTQRFQQLTAMNCFSSYKIKRMFIACCVLQNICLEEEDFFDVVDDPLMARFSVVGGNKEEENQFKDKPVDENAHLRKIGELKRKQIVAELKPEQ